MAICNLFNDFTSNSGNFMLFSQYTEDITKNIGESDNWKIVPTKFVALNIDYSKINRTLVNPKGDNLNKAIPRFFQNCFENACAWCKDNESGWNSKMFRNLFWNSMYNGKFINVEKYNNTNNDIVKEVVYYGNIDLHSYNKHKGMGYGEIYCYIPSDAAKSNCVIIFENNTQELSNSIIPPKKDYLEGYEGENHALINQYEQKYYINQDFLMSFESDSIKTLLPSKENYKFNTIVALYGIFRKENDNWIEVDNNIPIGMYVTGKFIGNDLTNTATKFVTTSYETGTSYGLRICSRFTTTANNSILKNTDITVDNSSYSNLCQLMTAMNENLTKMLNVTESASKVYSDNKELYSMIKNNRTNVPYVKDVNGTDCWFVNGRLVSIVNGGKEVNECCMELTPEVIEQRIKNLTDKDPSNDFTKIYTGEGCECDEEDINTLAAALKELSKDDFDFNWEDPRTTKSMTGEYTIASKKSIGDIFKIESTDTTEDHVTITNANIATNPDTAEELNS